MIEERRAAFQEATERIDSELGREHEEAFPRSIIALLATASLILSGVFLFQMLDTRWWIVPVALALISLISALSFALRGFGIQLVIRRRSSRRG
ncbi:hypothetical protein [Actinomadura livida]|nr:MULTISPECIES: hypothetical protein [Actinomadura]MBB4778503.1 fatty acid desaturase [Actinomadura catellatispora]